MDAIVEFDQPTELDGKPVDARGQSPVLWDVTNEDRARDGIVCARGPHMCLGDL